MATRSLIGKINTKDKSVETIYCHWDGYPEHNGVILNMFYDSKMLNKLLKMGDRSSLKPKVSKKETYAYRGETNVGSQKYANFAEFNGADKKGAEFVYLYEQTDKGLQWIAYSVNYKDQSLTMMGSMDVAVKFEPNVRDLFNLKKAC